MRRILIAFLAVLVLGVLWIAHALQDRADLGDYAAYRIQDAAASQGPGVHATFLGVSTILISDGSTALLTDGFFSRPSLLRTALGKIVPDTDRIASSLDRAGIDKLAAVIVVHSHYDHSMDAPEVARRTGALLIGSESTANVGRGWHLPEDQIRVVRPGEELLFGAFRVTLIRSRHFPHGAAMGDIRQPLVPPVRATEYLEGGSYSVLIEHPSGTILVHGSAGYVERALAGRQADVVFLGIGLLGGKEAAYRTAYWNEVVASVGAARLIPIHFDDFTRPLDEPLRTMPRLVDDFDASMGFLIAKARDAGVEIGLLPAWDTVRLF